MRRAFGFLTIVGRSEAPQPSTLWWFPAVGVVIGLVVGEVWWGATRLWPRPVAAALAVAADLTITGLLHADGLADAADGLLAPLPRLRRLEVMATPDVGAFGVAVVVVVVAVRILSLAAVDPGPVVAPLLVAGLWCGARTLMAVAVWLLPYARVEGGLASAFRSDEGGRDEGGRAEDGRVKDGLSTFGGGEGDPGVRHGRGGEHRLAVVAIAVGGGAASLMLGALGTGWSGLAASVVALGAGAAVLAFARRRIGGFTGDVLGAAGMLAESAGLLVAGARW